MLRPRHNFTNHKVVETREKERLCDKGEKNRQLPQALGK